MDDHPGGLPVAIDDIDGLEMQRLGVERQLEPLRARIPQLQLEEQAASLGGAQYREQLEAAEVEVKRDLEGPRGEVRIMTVHGAKGLEAPIVILPETQDRRPSEGSQIITLGDVEGAQRAAQPRLVRNDIVAHPRLDGGDGFDTASYQGSRTALRISLAAGLAAGTWNDTDATGGGKVVGYVLEQEPVVITSTLQAQAISPGIRQLIRVAIRRRLRVAPLSFLVPPRDGVDPQDDPDTRHPPSAHG